MFLAFNTLLGLPAHALLVHAAVVLVPLAAVGLAVTGWRTSWRRAYSIPVGLIGVAGGVSAYLAKESGESLERVVRAAADTQGVRARFGDHPEQGDTAMLFAMIFTLVLVAYVAVTLWGDRFKLPPWSGRAAYAIAVVAAIPAVIGIVLAGHSGATLVWKDLGTFVAVK